MDPTLQIVAEPPSTAHTLTTTTLLAKNTVLNIAGSILTPLAGACAIPFLVRQLSLDRYGILTLAWVTIGNFGLFDLGLGRALTKLVAEKIGTGRREELAGLIWSSLALMAAVGVLCALALGMSSEYIVTRILNIPAYLKPESIVAFRLLGLAIPVVVITAGLRGILEAQQRFDLANAVRVPVGMFMFLGPLMVAQFTQNLGLLVFTLLLARLLAWAVLLLFVLQTTPELRRQFRLDKAALAPLLRFSSWMAVSNILSPLMNYVDRLLIGTLLSMSALAYYATPYDGITTALGIFPAAAVGVLLPAFSAECAVNPARTQRLFSAALKAVFIAIYPITLATVTFAGPLLYRWLGSSFTQNSTHVLQYLAVGALINGLAQICFVLLQGAGYPALTAKLHIAEFPCYMLTMYLLVRSFGIDGAAVAWLARVTVDGILMFIATKRLTGGRRIVFHPPVIWMLPLGTSLLAIASLSVAPWAKAVFLATILPLFYVLMWRLILNREEKHYLAESVATALRRHLGAPGARWT